jgi:hypothetical protein
MCLQSSAKHKYIGSIISQGPKPYFNTNASGDMLGWASSPKPAKLSLFKPKPMGLGLASDIGNPSWGSSPSFDILQPGVQI